MPTISSALVAFLVSLERLAWYQCHTSASVGKAPWRNLIGMDELHQVQTPEPLEELSDED